MTEREVRQGIINTKNPEDHCLAYIRRIDHVNTSALRSACNFIDMVSRDIDLEAASLLRVLRDEILPGCLPESSIARFTVEWSGADGLDQDSHREYLRQFCNLFFTNVAALVDRAVDANTRLANDRVYSEVLQHLHACKDFCKIFQGREEIIARIRKYLAGSSRQPLLLYGESGCGKTSLLAKGYSQVSLSIDCYNQTKAVSFKSGFYINYCFVIILLIALTKSLRQTD